MAHEEFVRQAGVFIPPLELVKLVTAEHAVIPRAEFFNNSAHQPVRDAWQGAILATGFEEIAGEEVMVRLSSQEEFPDFQVRLNGVVHGFEAVMALNKPLGRIYKNDAGVGPVVLGRPETLPPLDVGPLRKAVEAKVNKHYAGSVNLSVYLNFSGSNAEFESVSAEVLTAAQGKFESVWLIARGNVAGAADEGAYFVCCAKESSDLPKTGNWYQVARIVGVRP